MAYPQAYQQLLDTYRRNQLAQLPEAQKLLAAQQQARGIYTSPIAQYGMTDLYNKYMQGISGKEAELGLQAAGAQQQESQFGRGLGMQERQLGSQESQFAKNLAQQGSQFGQNLGLQRERLGQEQTQFETGLTEAEKNRQWQERLAYQQQLSDLALAKKMANAQRNQMWSKLPFDLFGSALTGGLFGSFTKAKK